MAKSIFLETLITGYEPMRDNAGKVIGIWYMCYSADLNTLGSIINESGKGEFSPMTKVFNTLLSKLQNTIKDVSSTANDLLSNSSALN